jgi:hypothetical protein
MDKGNKKKNEKLRMSYGKANNILKKSIMFYLVQKLKLDICYRCGKKIESVDVFSVEHKTDWLNSETPVELFFDLDNIGFSHKICNILNGKKVPRKPIYTKDELLERKRESDKKYRSTGEFKHKHMLYMRSRYADPVFWERHKADSRKSYWKKRNNILV